AVVAAAITQNGNKLHVRAEVKNVQGPLVGKKLRLVLVEDGIRCRGANTVRFHNQVFRAFAGGPEGFALREKQAVYNATIDLDELRGRLAGYLKDQNRLVPVAMLDRPPALKELRLIALVQDDKTGEILQAAQTAVPRPGGQRKE